MHGHRSRTSTTVLKQCQAQGHAVKKMFRLCASRVADAPGHRTVEGVQGACPLDCTQARRVQGAGYGVQQQALYALEGPLCTAPGCSDTGSGGGLHCAGKAGLHMADLGGCKLLTLTGVAC